MKIQINKSLKEGFEILKKNPIIFLPIVFAGIISFFITLYLKGLLGEVAAMINYLSGEEIDAALILSSLPLVRITITLLIGGLSSFYFLLAAIKLISDGLKTKPSLGQAFITAFKRFIPVLLATILFFLLILAITCAAIVILAVFAALGLPGAINTTFGVLLSVILIVLVVFLQIKFFYYPYAGVIDNKGPIDSLKTSFEITRGNFWQTLALALITMLVAFVLAFFAAPFPKNIAPIIGALIQILTTGWTISVFASAYLQLRR